MRHVSRHQPRAGTTTEKQGTYPGRRGRGGSGKRSISGLLPKPGRWSGPGASARVEIVRNSRARQSGFGISLWQYSQSPLMVEPSLALCSSSWQRKQPFEVVWPRLSG